MKKIAFYTLGCRTNQSETEEMARDFERDGWKRVELADFPHLCVVQTCTVTGRSEAKVRQTIKKIAKGNPACRIAVVGCSVELDKEQFKKMPLVDYVANNREKWALHRSVEIDEGDDPKEEYRTAEPFIPKTRVNIKIQEGCNSNCTYCIVPTVRGRPKSVPFHKVIDGAREAIDHGFKEIVLAGTHIGLYHNNGKKLEDVLEHIAKIGGGFRIRLSSIEPMEISDRLIELVTSSPIICRHMHLSLQSLSDEILGKMNRSYVSDYVEKRLRRLQAGKETVRIGADIIVGFPGETEAQFEETCSKLARLPIHYGHVFRFSPRPGTEAAKMPARVPQKLMAERSGIIREILKNKHIGFLKSFLGKTLKVLIEDEHKRIGHAGNYLVCRIKAGPKLEKNHFYFGKVVGANLKNEIECIIEK